MDFEEFKKQMLEKQKDKEYSFYNDDKVQTFSIQSVVPIDLNFLSDTGSILNFFGVY